MICAVFVVALRGRKSERFSRSTYIRQPFISLGYGATFTLLLVATISVEGPLRETIHT